MKKPVHSDGDDQVSDNENSQAETEYEPNITTKQRENTQSNVGHAQENRPYPLFVRSEQERMIDEQLRKKRLEIERKKLDIALRFSNSLSTKEI
jgi:hypothetical protein